ncbi:helix-turn-helix transcriptional regulator [Microbacterium sp. 3J1]|uniref:helix-turn-helix transcriptional regulator n=1 Tax=Microbacterium sp. 3J1 TaxID=861269 RepID=UPI000B09EB25|nr:AraC family transcriptional regulator [Microbacterium sp. 3J1]
MQFRTRDVSLVESTWKQFVPSAVLHDVDPRRFLFDWHSADLGAASLVRYDLAAEVRSTAEPHDQFLACRVAGPDVRVWSDRGDLNPTSPWISDGPRVHAQWERGARVTALVFERDALQQLARRISGDDTLSLHVAELAPKSEQASAAWNRMFSYLESSAAALDDDDHVVRAELGRHAAATTLTSFTTSIEKNRHRSAQSAPAPATVRRALDFIAENAHRPITVDDVAGAVHMSTRGLQYAFRRALDMTPAECLKQARLDGAHRDLRSGAPSTVAAIARRWGFSHPSRFAVAYRDAFGVLPSVTAGTHRR